MLVNGENIIQRCPVIGSFEETGWNVQCPMSNQWSRQPVDNQCNYDIYNSFSDLSVQCYDRNYYRDSVPQQYYPQRVVYTQPPSFQADLPCRQRQEWDYNSTCYNVDGQPCQYTNVVDLEDFMNNEKRKEKSRVAARCRRTKEMQIFAELTAALPAKKEEVEQLDKASVMRLAISYLRVRDVVSMLPEDKEAPTLQSPKGLEEVQSELSYMKALDGFVLVLSQQGDIVYCSDNIAEHLGVSQMEIMGQSVFEFSHPCDHDEIREALRAGHDGKRDLLLRLKCTLTSKGRNVHLKSASYKVIHVTGHMLTSSEEKTKEQERSTDSEDEKKGNEIKKYTKSGALVAVGRPIPHPSNIEVPLNSMTFLTKHSLDMKFTDTDECLMNTLGYDTEELVGRSLYDYHHAADSAALAQQFKSLFSKGQCETSQYRFLAKSGGFAWVQTQATVITDKQQKPISVICINYVISGIECKDEVFAAHQVQHADLKPVVAPTLPAPAPQQICVPTEPANGAIVAAILPEEERPIPVTELIFAPRKKEMNKGFLMFSQEEGLTSEWHLNSKSLVLKDEPEDLTHLAPTAGDACIPLENSPFDMFDEFILSDNYCSLLGDDLANGSPVDSLIGDSLLSSPEPQENESSCEQSSLLTELSLDAFDNNRSDNDIDDGHSPFIPTTDELPLLAPAVMWGALPDNVSQARPQPSEAQTSAPALQRLLAAPPTGPQPQDLITNIYSDQGLIPSKSISTWDTGVKRVLKQEEEPTAKRVKRSPSPAPAARSPSSSVLMNLLDIHPQAKQINQQPPNYHLIMNSQKVPQQNSVNRNIPIPVINIIQSTPMTNGQIIRSNMSPMSPLTLNVGSPMYSLPSSPNTPSYSPAISPAPKDRILSPYSTPQSLSPTGSYQMYSPNNRLLSPTGVMQGYDPYLTTKMQSSPGFMLQSNEMLLDSNVPLTTTDFWPDSEILQSTSELLTAFDDVKLV
nr:hypoxia-inducible factor 1-alpha-like isoform X1 [Vanessa tameamea]